MIGTVKWYNENKGYGFIISEEDVEHFVHHSFLEEGLKLKENDKIEFESVDTEKGKQAKNISLRNE